MLGCKGQSNPPEAARSFQFVHQPLVIQRSFKSFPQFTYLFLNSDYPTTKSVLYECDDGIAVPPEFPAYVVEIASLFQQGLNARRDSGGPNGIARLRPASTT
jgi:hypothetical protein